MRLAVHTRCATEDRTDQAQLLSRAVKALVAGNPAYWGELKACSGALEGCMEWKPSSAMRNVCDAEVRIIFYVEEDTLYLLSAYYRDGNEVFKRAVWRLRHPQFES